MDWKHKRDRLRHLLDYYSSSRGVGHTLVLEEGIREYTHIQIPTGRAPCLLIGGTQTSAENIGGRSGVKRKDCVGWQDIGTRMLRGRGQPVALDNYAVMLILEDALLAIKELEFIIQSLKNQPHNID